MLSPVTIKALEEALQFLFRWKPHRKKAMEDPEACVLAILRGIPENFREANGLSPLSMALERALYQNEIVKSRQILDEASSKASAK